MRISVIRNKRVSINHDNGKTDWEDEDSLGAIAEVNISLFLRMQLESCWSIGRFPQQRALLIGQKTTTLFHFENHKGNHIWSWIRWQRLGCWASPSTLVLNCVSGCSCQVRKYMQMISTNGCLRSPSDTLFRWLGEVSIQRRFPPAKASERLKGEQSLETFFVIVLVLKHSGCVWRTCSGD